MRPSSKVFNDPIHGHIELSGLCVKIIDTPQFQRLRDISQLGGVYYVFSGAASRRFEHSLGVSHLAKQFVEMLRSNQPELRITDSDVLCLEVAGLCHDLGHGPFSHLFDGRFLPTINHNHDFAHEHASIGLFDHLIRVNNLKPVFSLFGLNEDDIQFIKELMLGDHKESPPGFVWKGRGNKTFLYDIVANKRNGIDVDKFDYFARDCHVLGVTKSFDSTRLLRFAKVFRVSRDTYGNRGRSALNDEVAMSGAINGSPQKNSLVRANSIAGSDASSSSSSSGVSPLEICFHVKEAWNLFELFHTRYALHKRAYQHRVGTAVELMLLEVMLLADPYLRFSGTGGELRKMSECPSDMEAYWKLTDSIIKQIETSYTDELAPARAMIQRLRVRDLFAFSGEIILSAERRTQLLQGGTAQIKREMLELLRAHEAQASLDCKGSPVPVASVPAGAGAKMEVEVVKDEDVFCEIVKISYGKGAKNPVSGPTAFYEPKKEFSEPGPAPTASARESNNTDSYSCTDSVDDELRRRQEEEIQEQNKHWSVGVIPQDSVSRLTPREFEETYIRVYSRYKRQAAIVRDIFQKWCQQNKVSQPITPMKRARQPSE
eukprot:CAMPEP_0170418732 /NCGR_PEP_ID=MMETSP0117_2-20130122/34422_1 /TAXON_ID=400756 /ORGANISM="Durinskia baltica, Strain CSIRO CS-38" /LENGTH=601 /DNA_ID=CAMNT_0010677035 /DNA_START=92 /DNA_END=1897 /DNA_ORIENTATION=+